MLAIVAAVAIQPAVAGRLHPRCPRFHVILRIEMTPRGIGRADGVQRRETLVVPQRFERREARVETEMAVEVDDIGPGNRDARPLVVIQRLAMRNDHVETINRAALVEAHQNWAARGGEWAAQGGKSGTAQKKRIQAQAEKGDRTRPQEYSSRNSHCR